MKLRSFEDLDAWQAAHQLTLAVYRVTKSFPKEELFGMTSQIRRAAASIEANLAEGVGRRTDREFLRSARIADGSLQEVKCFLRIGVDLGYLSSEGHSELRALADRAGALLGGLHNHLRSQVATGQRSAD